MKLLQNKQLTKDNTDALQGVFREALTKEKVPDSTWGNDGIEKHVSMGETMVGQLVNRYLEMPIEPIAIEKEYIYQWSKYIELNCRIDLIARFTKTWTTSWGERIPAGSIIIIDHKTSSKKYEIGTVDTADQLSFYSFVVREVDMIKESGVMFQVHLKHDSPKICDYLSSRNDKDIQVLREKVDYIINAIDIGYFSPVFKPDTCRWCDYRKECNSFSANKDRMLKEDSEAEKEGFILV